MLAHHEEVSATEHEGVQFEFLVSPTQVMSDPDSEHIIHALKEVDFLLGQDIFLTETARLADVVLPGASFGVDPTGSGMYHGNLGAG